MRGSFAVVTKKSFWNLPWVGVALLQSDVDALIAAPEELLSGYADSEMDADNTYLLRRPAWTGAR